MTRGLITQLEKFVASENIVLWLKEPNPAFDGSTPLQVVDRGEAVPRIALRRVVRFQQVNLAAVIRRGAATGGEFDGLG